MSRDLHKSDVIAIEKYLVLKKLLNMCEIGPIESLLWARNDFVTCPLQFTVSW